MGMSAKSMRAHVTGLVRQLKADNRLPPRASVSDVVQAMGLPKPILGRPPQGQDGCRSGDQIIVNDTITCRERRIFTAFHEITHILIERDGEIESQLLEYTDTGSDGYHWAIEELCQVGAAEFVMPSLKFAAQMEGMNWAVGGLEAAADAFGASIIAAGFQFVFHHPDPCTMVICEPVGTSEAVAQTLQMEASESEAARLTVIYTAHNHGSYPMCRSIVVPHDHIVAHVWKDGVPREAKAQGWYKKGESHPMDCEVGRLRGRVFAAFFPKGKTWVSAVGQEVLDFT